jgi:histidinol-phosphatase
MNPEWKNRYAVALDAAANAGRLAKKYFDDTFKIEWKADQSPVTVADRDAETLLRQELLGAFPKDGFLGEEYGDTRGTSGFRWIIDPIDGTRNFVRRIPIWATLVGLEYKDEQIMGVAVVPAMGETYRALRGDGAYRNDRPIHVSSVDKLEDALLMYSSLSWFMKAGREKQFIELTLRTQKQRGFGDFYGFLLVAQGSGEIMVEYAVHAWDVAAIKPIVEEAGGRFSDWDGTPSIHRPDVLVTNGKLHDVVLAILTRPSHEPRG